MSESPIELRGKGGGVVFQGTQSPGGGSMPGAAVVRGPFLFAFNTAGLDTGVLLYTPATDEILLDAWIGVDTVFDGTTPLADVGTFAGGDTSGLFNDVTGAVALSDPDRDQNGIFTGPSTGTVQSDLGLSGIQAGAASTQRIVPARFTGTETLKLVVSQDGTLGGAPIGGMAGAGYVYLLTAIPPFPTLGA